MGGSVETRRARRPDDAAATFRVLAPAVFVALWSTGFIGSKYGLPYAEPFTFLLIRMSIAGALIALIALLLRAPWPESPRAWADSAMVGLLLHAGYLGGVFFAIEHGVPAGIAAVIVSLQPVLTSALVPRIFGERIAAREWAGLLLGLLGVALVVVPGAIGGGAGALPAVGVIACVIALLGATSGTLYQKRFGAEIPLLSGTAVQFAACTAVFAILAPATERMEVAWTADFIGALSWLILVLSVGAILLLMTLLRHGSAVRVTSLFYLVPPATALEAYLLFGETLDAFEAVGTALVVCGVALVMAAPGGRGTAAPEPAP